jgi:predicted dehydrogenase
VQGQDYPIGYVRWTEQRNLASFLDLIAGGRVRVGPLITHRFPLDDAPSAYKIITSAPGPAYLGVVLTYPQDAAAAARPIAEAAPPAPLAAQGRLRLGLIGAGGFAKAVLLPAFKAHGAVHFRGVVSRQGLSAKSAAERFGFDYADTSEHRVLSDPDIDAIVIATRHNLHAAEVLAAAAAGKHVFVEKPLCIREDELTAIEAAYAQPGAPRIMVGFNRRFAPLAVRMKSFFEGVAAPLVAHYSVNAGFVPREHWVHDPAEGGGRIVGEACHFVDFLGWMFGETPARVTAHAIAGPGPASPADNMVITLEYPNGSVGTISYFASGDSAAGKEHVEVHGGGRSARLDDFRGLHLYRGNRETVVRHRFKQDKGHRQECAAFVDALTAGRPSPIPPAELFATMRATFRALESARTGKTLDV